MAQQQQRTVPYGPGLRTKAQRASHAAAHRRAVNVLQGWDFYFTRNVRVCLNSKRRNLKKICRANVVQVHHESFDYIVVELKDGRFVYSTKVEPGETVVSHDLENLWWYGLPEVARKALRGD